jgi:hypothetical protein
MRRFVLAIVVLSALLAAGAVTALATPGSSGQASAAQVTGQQMGSLGMRLQVSKFVKSGHRLVAKGRAVATYRSADGTPTVKSQPFSAHATVLRHARILSSASQTGTCPVLTLELDQVSLDLLGLHVDLSKVVLTITADPTGGILGKLFCSLSSGKTSLASASTARTLTKAAHRSGLSTTGVAFGTPTRQLQTLGPGPCSIVDLLLGPLHLDLLGLIVDLNQVHLQITADPNGGILGSLLCSIAGTTTTTTAPTTT